MLLILLHAMHGRRWIIPLATSLYNCAFFIVCFIVLIIIDVKFDIFVHLMVAYLVVVVFLIFVIPIVVPYHADFPTTVIAIEFLIFFNVSICHFFLFSLNQVSLIFFLYFQCRNQSFALQLSKELFPTVLQSSLLM